MKNTDKEVRDVIENLEPIKELDAKEYETIMHRTKKFDELDKLISRLKELSESFNDNPDDPKFYESEHLVSKLKKLTEGFKDNPDDFLFITYLEKGDQSYRTVCSDWHLGHFTLLPNGCSSDSTTIISPHLLHLKIIFIFHSP